MKNAPRGGTPCMTAEIAPRFQTMCLATTKERRIGTNPSLTSLLYAPRALAFQVNPEILPRRIRVDRVSGPQTPVCSLLEENQTISYRMVS